jgi:hypothetical protein
MSDDEYTDSDEECFEQCGNCDKLFDDNYVNEYDCFHECDTCGARICSYSCMHLTGCQTISCICNKCFHNNYKKGICIDCNINPIEYHELYLWDHEPHPYCKECMDKVY